MVSDKSKDLIAKRANEFMHDLRSELEIIGASWCQVQINYNKGLDVQISAKIEISHRETFCVENDKITP